MRSILINLVGKTITYRLSDGRTLVTQYPTDASGIEGLVIHGETYKTPEQEREDQLIELALGADPSVASELIEPWRAGELVKVGNHRAYDGKVYIVRQAHVTQRDWTPDITPALFSVFNQATGAEPDPETGETPVAPWIIGEAVSVGDRREYHGSIYKVIQSHTTQAGWTPDLTPSLWEKEI